MTVSCCDRASKIDGLEKTDRGDWYLPNGTRLNFNVNTTNIYEVHLPAQRVDLHRTMVTHLVYIAAQLKPILSTMIMSQTQHGRLCMQDCMPVEASGHTCAFDSIVIDAVVVHFTNQRHSV